MALTLFQIQSQVRTHLRDDAKTFITDPNIADWVNNAQNDLAARLGTLHKSLSSTTPDGTGTIPLPADFISADRMNISYSFGPDDVTWVDNEIFQSWKEDSGSPTPEVRLGRIYGSNIELYPAPASGTAYTLRYARTPTTLVNSNDTSELDPGLHIKFVYYAAWQANLMAQEFALASEFAAMYEQGLPPPYTGGSRDKPGPFSLPMTLGPFDTSDAAHF